MRKFLVLAAIILALAPSLVSAHDIQMKAAYTCDNWYLYIWSVGDTPDPHRMIVTENDRVVSISVVSNVGWLLKQKRSGLLPATKTFRVYLYDTVNGSYLYTPRLGSYFRPSTTIGAGGLVDYSLYTVKGKYTCSGYRGVQWGG